MIKIIVFDSVNLKTALLARYLLDTHSDIWVFMVGEVSNNNDPMVFKDSDAISWLLNFCNVSVAKLHNYTDDECVVCVPDVSRSTLIERLLAKPNLSLTSDTPCTIDFENNRVRIDDTVAYSYVPFGDIKRIFVSQPIDMFYNFKFGYIMYRTPILDQFNEVLNSTVTDNVTDIWYEPNRCCNSNFASTLTWSYDKNDIRFFSIVYLGLTTAKNEAFAVDSLFDDNVKMFKRYLKHNRKKHKKISYIGPNLQTWPANPYLIDLDTVFNELKKV